MLRLFTAPGRRVLRQTVLVAAAVTLSGGAIVGCDSAPSATPESKPATLTADPELAKLLVTSADFPQGGLTVADMTKEAIEASKKTPTATASPPECDGSKITSTAGGAVASVTATAGAPPQAVLILNRDDSISDTAQTIKDWLDRCSTFEVTTQGNTVEVRSERLEPPAEVDTNQVGFSYSVTAPAPGGTLTTVMYVTQVGDIAVTAMSMGGKGWGGKDIEPDLDVLGRAYVAQVAKVKADG